MSTFSSLDTSACWAQCFRGDSSHHAAFLDIVLTLQVVQCCRRSGGLRPIICLPSPQREQAARGSQGTCFVLDGAVSGQHAAPAAVYNYERNLAILLALALPVNTTNPMFAVLQSAAESPVY